MRRKIVLAITIIVCFLLQCTVFKALAIASISPNLLIVVVASFGFMRGKKEGLFVGFFSGLLLDVMFGSVIGFYALIYMYIGYMNGFFKRIFFPDEVKLPLALIAVSDFFCNLLIYFSLFWFRGRFSFGYYPVSYTHLDVYKRQVQRHGYWFCQSNTGGNAGGTALSD